MTVQRAAEDLSTQDGWEYHKLRLPPGVTRWAAAAQLAIHAEFSGWELSTLRLYPDGTRQVWLRRKPTPAALLN